jgi:DNA-binding LacI/PurR family transcriptional regulator
MGAMAISAMLERLRSPTMPAREILLSFQLVVRESSGSQEPELAAGAAS